MENKFNVGDKVICKPGFNTDGGGFGNKLYGGHGYFIGEVLTVISIDTDKKDENATVYWFKDHIGGIYQRALQLHSEEPEYEIY